jgi:hypothetical protein
MDRNAKTCPCIQDVSFSNCTLACLNGDDDDDDVAVVVSSCLLRIIYEVFFCAGCGVLRGAVLTM